MTTIRITKEIKEKLQETGDGASMTVVLNKLMDNASKPNRLYDVRELSSSIYISKETLDRLKEYKLTEHETHTDTIRRLLQEFCY